MEQPKSNTLSTQWPSWHEKSNTLSGWRIFTVNIFCNLWICNLFAPCHIKPATCIAKHTSRSWNYLHAFNCNRCQL